MYQGTLEPLTNRQSWTQLIQLTDPETGQPFDITGFSIQFEVRQVPPHWDTSGYTSYWSGGSIDVTGALLVATTANGQAQIIAPGLIQIYFPESQLRGLRPMTYGACCTITDTSGINTAQILRCRLPVLYGGVTN